MSAMGFSLAGGTAMALYFGHRRSIVLDWFTDKRIGDVLKLAHSVRQRGSKKDFVDIVALLQHHTTLKRMLILYARKYSISDTLHVLNALVYFDDTEPERMPRMLWDLGWPTVKRRLRAAVVEPVNKG